LLRRTQSVAFNLEGETREAARPEAERPATHEERSGLSALRAEMQRKLAAQIDLGSPESAPAEVERIVIPKVTERRRLDTLRAEVQRTSSAATERRTLSSFLPGSRRMRITPPRILLILVAVAAGGLAAYLATQHDVAPQPATQASMEPAPKIMPEPRTQILVAKGPIGIGQRLGPGTVEWQDWPTGALLPQYVTIANSPKAMTEMATAVARFELFPGEPIRKDKLALPGQGYLSAVLDSGSRGVSVTISADSASGGFIVPDDHVDVVVTRTANGQTFSDTILHNVRVLAINKRLGETGTTGAPADANANDPSANVFSNQAIATLALNPTQSEVIISAAATGKLSLVLRSLVDFPKAQADGQGAGNAAIRLTSPFWVSGTNGGSPQALH